MGTYTNEEIQRNIKILTDKVEILKIERKDINEKINLTNKQIKEWEDLDVSQFKMFE